MYEPFDSRGGRQRISGKTRRLPTSDARAFGYPGDRRENRECLPRPSVRRVRTLGGVGQSEEPSNGQIPGVVFRPTAASSTGRVTLERWRRW